MSHQFPSRRIRRSSSLRQHELLEQRLPLSGAPPAAELQDVIVLLDQASDPAAIGRATAAVHGGELGHVYVNVAGFSASLPEAAIAALSHNPNVLSIEPDQEAELFAQVTPTGIERTSATSNSVAAIDGATGNSNGGAPFPFVLATIDTGVDVDHPDLNANAVDGVNFVRSAAGDLNFNDGNGHGTHVAGTMAAIDNGDGVVGMAPGARIWAARAFGNNGRGDTSDILAAMDRVITEKDGGLPIAVVNMSFSMSGSSSATPFLQQMAERGITISAAAGNYGGLGSSFPGSSEYTISTAAAADSDGLPGGLGPETSSGDDDTIALFSNCCRTSDIAAPGVDILSTWKGGGLKSISGTSMASPHVGGAAGLFIAQYADAWYGGLPFDLLDTVVVREALVQTAVAGGEWLVRADDPTEGEYLLRADGGWTVPPVVSFISEPPPFLAGVNTLLVDARDVDTTPGALSFQIDLKAADGSKTVVTPTSTEYLTTGGPYGSYQLTWDASTVAGGTYQLSVVAVDVEGNHSDPSARLTTNQTTVVIDDGVNDAPVVDVIAPLATDGTVGGTVALQAEASDDAAVSSVSFVVTDAAAATVATLAAEETVPATPTSPAIWTAFWDTIAVSNGDYTITATALDDEGVSSSPDVEGPIVIDNDVATEGTLFVADLDGESVDDSGPFWYAIARVQIQDESGVPVEGATVYGDWVSSGGSTAQTWSLTDAEGWIEHRFVRLRSVSSPVTFTVNRVEHPNYTYQQLLNTDPDGDSSITETGEISIQMFEPSTSAAAAAVFAQFGSQGFGMEGDLNRDGVVDLHDFVAAKRAG